MSPKCPPMSTSGEKTHTPPPWAIDEHGRIYHRLDPLTKFVIAEMESGNEADERLIIAAPDMFAALKMLKARGVELYPEEQAVVDAAIALATPAEGERT